MRIYLVQIHLVRNSANVNYSKNQKSHYARTQCLGAKPNSQYMHSLHADFSECTVTKLAVYSILKSYAYLVVTNFERRAENGNFLLLFVCIMLQAPAVLSRVTSLEQLSLADFNGD